MLCALVPERAGGVDGVDGLGCTRRGLSCIAKIAAQYPTRQAGTTSLWFLILVLVVFVTMFSESFAASGIHPIKVCVPLNESIFVRDIAVHDHHFRCGWSYKFSERNHVSRNRQLLFDSVPSEECHLIRKIDVNSGTDILWNPKFILSPIDHFDVDARTDDLCGTTTNVRYGQQNDSSFSAKGIDAGTFMYSANGDARAIIEYRLLSSFADCLQGQFGLPFARQPEFIGGTPERVGKYSNKDGRYCRDPFCVEVVTKPEPEEITFRELTACIVVGLLLAYACITLGKEKARKNVEKNGK